MQVMDSTFSPRGRGRPSLYDIKHIVNDLETLDSHWAGYHLTLAQARSAKRQLVKLGVEVSIERTETGAYLFVRRSAG